MTRREFVMATGGLAVSARAVGGQQTGITARQVVERIKANIGVPWRADADTVDTFKAGNPDAVVRGIATTVMATFSVIERAAAAGRNFVISHEPTFYNHTDATTDYAADPVYQRKQAIIKEHDMVVFRFHDHLHMRRPEPMMQGLLSVLDWSQMPVAGRICTIPTMPLEAVVRHLSDRLKVQGLRVLGERRSPISKVAFMLGFGQPAGMTRALTDADLVIIGEQREWEGLSYAHDVVSAGRGKGVMVLGHAVSEEPGMKVCADWLKTFIPEVPIELIPAGEPFWRL